MNPSNAHLSKRCVDRLSLNLFLRGDLLRLTPNLFIDSRTGPPPPH
jgi:hypothetical protein